MQSEHTINIVCVQTSTDSEINTISTSSSSQTIENTTETTEIVSSNETNQILATSDDHDNINVFAIRCARGSK